jgi:subtilisin family serine protease
MALASRGRWTFIRHQIGRGAAGALALAAAGACSDAGSPTGGTPASVRQAASSAAAAANAAPAADVIPGQYIVQFTNDVRDVPGSAKQIVAQYAGELRFTYLAALKGFAAKLPDQAIAALQRNPNIAAIEPDMVVRAIDTQTSPPSWGLDRIDQNALPLSGSYTYANNGAGVNVYIIDTGIRTTHVEIAGRAFSGYTAIADTNGTNDCNGHGTHVSGTVGGTNVGVAKGVKLYAVRVLDCSGSGSSSGVIAGLDWVATHRVLPASANMSLGGGLSSALNTAVANTVAAGVVVAVAAGNSNADACKASPASEPSALTVGASASNDAQASFSNWGTCVDLYAPGVGIYSSWGTGNTVYANASGTSMATPHVAGAAALYLAANPSATPSQVAQALVGSATPGVLTSLGVGSPNLLLYTGNIGGGGSPPPPPPPPTDQAPTASFSQSCPKGRCSFDASSSTDDLGIVSYSWSFGDGSAPVSASTPRTTHTYTVAGSYTVKLTVTDGIGQTGQAQTVVKFKHL